ncbi:cilia- and flagella-associated protein 161 isoform X2 [Gymnodraco acuticeps]|uniref:Cilia- and flagella-associated protein 161 isoform X2 n=1 Tax=Gymnodraco acuticeps TaxID=8218 RepID=A0A6P8VGP3_GYMAC|nr:cilia- and flagella-associated protein 161 isoform X2 [Gymnodraco acuticeps]
MAQYRTSVKIGNWNEELRLEEVDLTVTTDGRLHFGDVVMLVNMGGEERDCSALSINADVNSFNKIPTPSIISPCGVVAGRGIQACPRTAFIITSVDGSPEGSTLHFDQSFALKTTSGFARGLYLTSDLQSFQKCAKKSRLQEVNLEDGSSFLSWWKIVHFDPQERLEYEGQPVPANMSVLIIHCKTNQALAVLGGHVIWNTYGKEYEMTAHTFLDSHKAEQDNNRWTLCNSDPAGEGLVLLTHPQLGAPNKVLTQADPGI